MKCIIGLGNPGKEYGNTRHNIGYMMIDLFREKMHFTDWNDSKFHGLISLGSLTWEKILLLKPTTYMNCSGQSVAAIIHFYKLDPAEDILVLSDDIDMDFAKVRFRTKGSHGGQNGLRSIIESLWSDVFSRIKIGIGRDEKYSVSDWVLSKLRSEELDAIDNEVYHEVEKYIHTGLWDSISSS